MSNHTPGPWHTHETARGNTEIVAKSTAVANVVRNANTEKAASANARLIAAAPELLAEGMAAEATLTLVLLTVSLPEELHTQVRDDLTTLRAGIAKATGP